MSLGKFEAIYYPYFEPPVDWLKTYLLFYDRIKSIIPEGANYNFSDSLNKILDSCPDCFSSISPGINDIKINTINFDILEQTFNYISSQNKHNNERTIVLDKQGSISISGFSFLHQDKVSENVRILLRKYNLVDKDGSNILSDIQNGQYIIVNENACDLIVSNVASNLSKKYGLPSLTDKLLFNSFNNISELSTYSGSGSSNMLASSVINLLVPDNISLLSEKDYLELKQAFNDLKVPFHRLIKEQFNLYSLNDIHDENELKEKVKSISIEFSKEYSKFRQTRWIKKFKKWGPIGIGSLFTLAGATFSNPIIAISSAATSITIQIISESKLLKSPQNNKSEVYSLLASLEDKILYKTISNELLIENEIWT
ncbi:hypothetical protein DGMP_22810 [Desulfomarina profundi]|uniref:Uncharacterized protein n=1 Tax=Desulfomarina profundi TaxID=2772557 RepID=A0A8D5FHS7_9BACT|nr:hypothetical protein [Desulfomarina profundi]BCL61588.1 hypothetical protein DGMP_22810 [Desulfomarina profundi]